MNVGDITAVFRVVDQASGDLNKIAGEVKKSEGGFAALGTTMKGVGVAAAAAVAAVGAVTTAIIKIGEYGSGVGDVTEQFGKLAEKAGLDATQALTALREATAGTVSDLDLMKSTLPLLSSGFKGNAEDLRVMAEAARVLSERGMTLDQAMQSVTSAMTTGRTRALAMQGVVIDTAQSMKNLTDAANDEGEAVLESSKLHMKQQEILKGLKGLVAENGAVMLDFSDRVNQAKVSAANFYNELARRISESEAVIGVMDRVGQAVVEAFGGEQEAAMTAIMGVIDRVAAVIGDVLVKAVTLGAEAFAWLRERAEGFASSGALAAALAFFGTLWDLLKLVWTVVTEVGKALLWLGDKLGVFAGIETGFKAMGKAVEWVSSAVQFVVDDLKVLMSVIDDLRGKDPGLPKVTGGFDDLTERGFKPAVSAADALAGKLGPVTQQLQDTGTKASATAAELQKLADAQNAMTGQKIVDEANTAIATYVAISQKGLIPTREEQEKLHQQVLAAIDVYDQWGQDAPQQLKGIEIATRKTALAPKELTEMMAAQSVAIKGILDDLGTSYATKMTAGFEAGTKAFQTNAAAQVDALRMLEDLEPDSLQKRLAAVHRDFEDRRRALDKHASNYQSSLATIGRLEEATAAQATEAWRDHVAALKAQIPTIGSVFRDTLNQIPGILQAALTGGGGVGAALQSIVSNLGAGVGKVLGTKLADTTSGLLGKLGAKLGGAIFDMIPGIGGALGSMVGPLLGKVFGGKSEAAKADYAATDQIKKLQAELLTTYGSLEAIARAGGDAGRELVAAWGDRSQAGLKHFQELLDIFNGKVSDSRKELADLQATLQDRTVMDWEKAKEVIEKYGGTLDTLGEKFTAAKLAADWKSIWDDWETLIDMGADVGGTLDAMKEEIGNLVNESLRIGTEIPEQFKPLIEELIRTGKLFDENGDAITDISKLKFGPPLVSEVDKIIAAIDRLIEALTVDVPNAFETATNVRVPVVKIPYEYENTGSYDPTQGGSQPTPQYAEGTKGQYVDFGKGTLVTLHGWEAIVPRQQVGGVTPPGGTSGGGGDQTITVPVILDGKAVTEVIIRRVANRLSVAGVKV